MDAEERALLDAVIAHPDEDAVRLVYADWLQEHDRPERAEYIRLSIRLANLRYGEENFDSEVVRLLARRRPLVERYYKTWQRDFGSRFPANRDVSFIFQRGFVEEVRCSVKYYLDNAERISRDAPIRWFWPNALAPISARRLTASPWIGLLRGIRIFDRERVLVLLGCDAPGVRALDFSHRWPGGGDWNPVAVRMASHPGLAALKHIGLGSCGIGDAGGRALAESPHLNPDVLNLLGNELSAAVRVALRARYGSRVWLDPSDRNGFPRNF
jgi:uncharacterized protein (TIGR02996 family)